VPEGAPKEGGKKIFVVDASQWGDIGVARGVGMHCDSTNTYSVLNPWSQRSKKKGSFGAPPQNIMHLGAKNMTLAPGRQTFWRRHWWIRLRNLIENLSLLTHSAAVSRSNL
jgi:hypothetical protein